MVKFCLFVVVVVFLKANGRIKSNKIFRETSETLEQGNKLEV